MLGGTEGNDIIVSGEGDDTVYGDGGNDRLEGGNGNDVILGGAGDDIITDIGGDDNLQGGEGNDVIQAGNSTLVGNVILGGAGSDFIITTEDISTIFGGEGNDFILGAKVNLQEMGGEGDDWIEKGTQDGAPGDNFNPRLDDDVIGNDVFVGGGGFDEFIGEGGDDIFVGSDAQDKMEGMSGFDWVTYKNDRFGVSVDLRLANLGGIGEVGDHIALAVAASPSSILDRFDEVEGLSGSAFGDILRGDNVDAVTIVNHGGATGGVLTNIGLIDGLQDFIGAGVTDVRHGQHHPRRQRQRHHRRPWRRRPHRRRPLAECAHQRARGHRSRHRAAERTRNRDVRQHGGHDSAHAERRVESRPASDRARDPARERRLQFRHRQLRRQSRRTTSLPSTTTAHRSTSATTSLP